MAARPNATGLDSQIEKAIVTRTTKAASIPHKHQQQYRDHSQTQHDHIALSTTAGLHDIVHAHTNSNHRRTNSSSKTAIDHSTAGPHAVLTLAWVPLCTLCLSDSLTRVGLPASAKQYNESPCKSRKTARENSSEIPWNPPGINNYAAAFSNKDVTILPTSRSRYDCMNYEGCPPFHM